MTQLEIIQKFMGALNKHGYVSDGSDNSDTTLSTAMLDEAIRACSPYSGIQDAMNKFLSAAKSSTSDTFLAMCGIDLTNNDTGGILGFDVGSSSVEKNSDTTVLEVGNLYTADDSSTQIINTGSHGWLVQATTHNDTIFSGGEDSINAGDGNDFISISGRTASIVTGGNNDTVSVSGDVKYFTVKDYVEGSTKIVGADNYDSTIEGGTAFFRLKDWSSEVLNVTSVSDTQEVSLGDTISVDLSEVDTLSGYYVKTGDSVSSFSSSNQTNDLVGTVSSNFIPSYLDEDEDGNLSFTYRGLTLNIIGERDLDTGEVTYAINADNFNSLNDTQNSKYYQYIIISGLYKWWLKESLDINEKVMGFGFTDEGVSVNQIDFYFENDPSESSPLAYVHSKDIDEAGKTRSLDLVINTDIFSHITNDDDPNCEVYVNDYGGTLDRTLAHEFNHADFAANVDYFDSLPLFIAEGMAELVHGIDDSNEDTIQELLTNPNMLDDYINLQTSIEDGGSYPYAAGYMFLRWLAKTSADSVSVPLGQISAQVNLGSGTGNYYISGSSTSLESATLAESVPADNVSVGSQVQNVYTADNGVKQLINFGNSALNIQNVGSYFTVNAANSNADNTVMGYGGNISVNGGNGLDYVTISGAYNTVSTGDGNDTIFSSNAPYNLIQAGAGNDSIIAGGQAVSIYGGAGADSVLDNTRSSYQFINLGEGNNLFDNTDTTSGGNYRTDSNTIIGGSGNDSVKALWAYDYSIALGDGANFISLAGGDNSINLGAGNDSVLLYYSASSSLNTVDVGDGDNYVYISNDVANNSITAGAGDDSVNVGGDNNFISVGAGDDTISIINFEDSTIDNSNFIDAGSGNDLVELFSFDNSISTGEGNDTLQVGNYSSIKYTITAVVTDFDENDVISFVNSIDSFSFDSDSKVLTADKVSISLPNIDTSSEIYGWDFSDTSAHFTFKTSGEFSLTSNKKGIVYTAGESSTLVSVDGVISADGLTLDESASTVTISESSLGTDTVTVSTGYSLALGSDVATSTSIAAGWSFENSAATYSSAGTTEGYTLTDNAITYSAGSSSTDLVTVSGVTSADGLTLNESSSTVTVAASSLGTDTVTISAGYTLALGSDVATSTSTGGSWAFDDDVATYSTAGTTAGYTLTDNTITYAEESDGSDLVTVSGVTSADGLTLNESSSTVTVAASSLGTDTVTISAGYSLALAEDVPSPTSTTEGYILTDNTISYQATSEESGETINNNLNVTIITGTAYADTINNTGSNVTINALGGGDSISNTDNNQSYIDAGEGNDYIENTLNYEVVTLASGTESLKNYYSDTTIVASAGNDTVSNVGGFNVSVIGGGGDDSIFARHSYYSTIEGGAGNDVIEIVEGNREYILGDAGNDTIIGNSDTVTNPKSWAMGGYATIDGGDGDDYISTGYANNSSINGGAGADTISVSGANIEVTGGDDADIISLTKGYRYDGATLSSDDSTIYGGAGDDTIDNTDNNRTYIDAGEGDDFILNSLHYEIVTLDGATVGSLQNEFSDTTIVAGAGNDTVDVIGGFNVSVIGGGGDDKIFSHHSYYKTIEGGAGNDRIEITEGHNENISGGDGNDTIVGTILFEELEGDWAMGNNADIDGGAGADYISIGYSDNASIDGGADDDTIIAYGKNSEIKGGEGNDSIALISNGEGQSADGTTITGGAGDDTITITESGGVFLDYTYGDGNDVIIGFTENDTLNLSKTGRTSTVSGNDLIITAGESKITLKDAASLENPNINVPYEESAEGFVMALQRKTALGYPFIAGVLFHPNEYHGFETLPSNYYAESETLTITSTDGLELAGYHYTPANSNDKWAIIIHGYGHNHNHMNAFAMFYLANNYNVLMVDQRAAGASEGEWLTMGAAEGADIALWTHKVAEINPLAKITLHGVSMGAATAMLAAANSNLTNVTSLVEDCGYTTVMNLVDLAKGIYTDLADPEFVNVVDYTSESLTGYKLSAAAPIDSIGNATVPTMFITGTSDAVVPPTMLETLYAASGAEVKEIFTVEGATHALSALTDSIGYANAVFRFNAEAAGEGWITSNVTDNISIRGTKYADTITNNGSGVTLNTGAGDDTITNNSSNVVYEYTAGDGNDVIIGVTSNDTIVIDSDTYVTLESGNDKVVSIVSSGNTITLKDATNAMPVISGKEYTIYVDKGGNTVANPVAMIASGDSTYYYESVSRASNDADENATVTVIADSTETSTINADKGLTIQFAESGLGVYSVSGGNFVSAENSVATQISISASKVLSNANSLKINNGATATLDGYVVTGTANGYSFALQENALTFDSISYSGLGTATFDTLGKITLTSGAVVEGTNEVTSSTGISIAAGEYTINNATMSASAEKVIYADSEGVNFQMDSDTLTYKDIEFSGKGYATIQNDLPTLTAGVNATKPERLKVVLTEKGDNTLDGRGFQMTEQLADGITVGAVDNGIGAAHIIPYESFPEDAGKLFAEEALIYNDDDYTVRLDKDGIRSIYGISNGASLRGRAYFEGEVDTLGSILQFGLDGEGVYHFSDKTYTVSGSAINDSVVIGMISRFYNDDTALLREVKYLNGTVSGNFDGGVSVNGSTSGVSISGDVDVNVIATEDGIQAISGVNSGASIKSAGGATKVTTNEEGMFYFRYNGDNPEGVTLQNFTVSGDDSVDFILRNYTDASGKPTMQVEGINNFENGTLIFDEGTKYTGINVGDTIKAEDEFEMEFIGNNVIFTIADSKVVSIDGINDRINNIKGDVTVHGTQAITVNNKNIDVTGDSDFNVIVEGGITSGLNKIGSGSSISVDSMKVTTNANGNFTFTTDNYEVEDTDGSVTFITRYDGKVENITDFAGTLKSSAASVTVNGIDFTTSNTDALIISEGAGISRIEGLNSGDTVSGTLSNTKVIIPAKSETDTSIITINSVGYTLTGDADSVGVTDKRIDGLDGKASLMVGAAGRYIVNDTELTAQVGDIFIGTSEGSAYVYDANNLPLDVEDMSEEEIESQVGITTSYSRIETDTMTTALLAENGGNGLNGSMELLFDNAYGIVNQAIDLSNSTGRKKVTLSGGEQSVKFNSLGGNVVVIDSSAEGEKNITLGGGGDLIIIKGTTAPVNIVTASSKDTIVTAGGDVVINMAGGAAKIVPNGGNITLNNYDASAGGGVQLNETSDIGKAIANGNIQLGNGEINVGTTKINLGNSGENSAIINLYNNKGVAQKVGYTYNDGGAINAAEESADMLLYGNTDGKGGSVIMAGSGDDEAYGGAGDYFDLGAGKNHVTINEHSTATEGATVAMTATKGVTEVDGFNYGYGANSDKVCVDMSSAKVSYANGQLTFKVGRSQLILNNAVGTSADLIADDNFIGDTTLDDITPITYEQGEMYNATARETLSTEMQITFAQG